VLGGRAFVSQQELMAHMSAVLNSYRPGETLAAGHATLTLELLRAGHRDLAAKVGPGVQSVGVCLHPRHGTRCFTLCRTDGSTVDFSYRKCCNALFDASWSSDLVLFGDAGLIARMGEARAALRAWLQRPRSAAAHGAVSTPSAGESLSGDSDDEERGPDGLTAAEESGAHVTARSADGGSPHAAWRTLVVDLVVVRA